jgi:hypothetical protein
MLLCGFTVSHERVRQLEAKLLPVRGEALRKRSHGIGRSPGHQEGKYEIVPSSDRRSGVWRSLKAVYSVTGWVIFSLALVPFSGSLKQFDRDAA